MRDRKIRVREAEAVARWKPGQRWYHPAMARIVIATSRFITSRMNHLEVTGSERLDVAREHASRGLLTICNHVSLFDDPILISNFASGPYDNIRWVAADAINFFGSAPKSWLFTAGKSVPVVRGAGIHQPGMRFLRDRLVAGEWVQVFPEAGRTRDPRSLMQNFHPGVGWLVAESNPLVVPFYHYGMQNVLPVGSVRPRGGNAVTVRFGQPIDCGADWISKVACDARSERNGPRLWSAIAAGLEQTVRELELSVNPAAIPKGAADA